MAQERVQAAPKEVFVPRKLKEKDTFSLMADYRDPFFGTVRTRDKAPKKASVPTKAPVPEKAIAYAGFVTDGKSKQRIFFVTIDGQQQMMSLNDSFQEVKLIQGTEDRIKVRHGGKIRTIFLTQ